MKILVLGSNGQLGLCFIDQLKDTRHNVIYASRQDVDVTDCEQLKNLIFKTEPDVVINATGYTAVDRAEQEIQEADSVNHVSVKNIAEMCVSLDCWFIHFSTDYVFDGNHNLPYNESDKTNPQGVYGTTKLNGEMAVKSSGCKYIIIRTAWVFSEYGQNFLKTMLHLATKTAELRVVSDQIGNPTYAHDIARGVVSLLPRLNINANIIGTYHLTGDTTRSWAAFAEDIFNEAMKLSIIEAKPNICHIKTEQFPAVAKRPANSVLDSTKFKDRFSLNSLSYTDGLRSSLLALKNAYKK